MRTTYFLDESGTTGDLAGRRSSGYGGQPIYALACVEVDDQKELSQEIARLKQCHKVQGAELKSSFLVDKPQVVSELVAYLWSRDLAVFIEVVDKRFNIVAYMATHLLTMPFDARSMRLRSALADRLADVFSDGVLESYRAACQAPSLDALRQVFADVIKAGDNSGDPMLQEALCHFVGRSVDAFEENPSDEAVRQYLPIPDVGKSGQLQWILPELTSLTNIYGRLNQFHKGRLAEVSLVHDEHAHFEDILRGAMEICGTLVEQGMELRTAHSDFRFGETATLLFGGSQDNPGIQLADVLAGFVMRYTQDMIADMKSVSEERTSAFWEIIGLSTPGLSIGTNFVMPSRILQRIGIAHDLPF